MRLLVTCGMVAALAAARAQDLPTTGEIAFSADFGSARGTVLRTNGLEVAFRDDPKLGTVLEAVRPELVAARRLQLPLKFLPAARGAQAVTVRVEKAVWSLETLGAKDEDWPTNTCPVAGLGPLTPRTVPDAAPLGRPIQFFTPKDWNAWAGDVALGVFKGRFHVFYLYDRRHHRSKGGCGGHQFAHLSSDDLVHWVEHPMAVPITELWQSVGTGTPFVKDGRLCLAYGWHTERFPWATDKPRGATWAVSEDGIHFTQQKIMFHTTRNPTIYNRADGRLGLVKGYGMGGFCVSDGDLLKWTDSDSTVPFGGDCPCYFEWNGHHYLLQGFYQMAHSATGKPGSWEDWGKTGDDVYGGLSVPMVAPWKDRWIIGGWVRHLDGWGAWLVFHELVQFPDGKLGEKWADEFLVGLPPPKTFEVAAGKSFEVRFSNGGKTSLVLAIDAAQRCARWCDETDGVRKCNLREHANKCATYAIGKVRGLDRPYRVRLLLHYCEKSDITVFDAEIAGTRTMICVRRGRWRPSGGEVTGEEDVARPVRGV